MVILMLMLKGCINPGAFVDALNERQVQSCINIIGFSMPFVLTRITTATGGATLELCERIR